MILKVFHGKDFLVAGQAFRNFATFLDWVELYWIRYNIQFENDSNDNFLIALDLADDFFISGSKSWDRSPFFLTTTSRRNLLEALGSFMDQFSW